MAMMIMNESDIDDQHFEDYKQVENYYLTDRQMLIVSRIRVTFFVYTIYRQ